MFTSEWHDAASQSRIFFFRPDETALARRAKEKSRLTLT
jgi:hypothetical protein